jgi:hypothetical protein
MEGGVKRYRFELADCAAIVDELDPVDLFYETVWSYFERHVPTKYSGCEQKLPWMTRELTSLKNNKARASKKRCLKDDAIDNC